MMLVKFSAKIQFPEKTRAVRAGFRPTFLIGDRKALCNIDTVTPEPLEPWAIGQALLTISWEWPGNFPIEPGAKFTLLEGERRMGSGEVVELVEIRQ